MPLQHHMMYLTKSIRKYVSKRGPEARLYIACLVALLLPTSMFIYAWTADPQIFWMWPVVGLTVCSLFHVVGSAHHTVKLDLHVLFVCFVSGSFYIFGGLVSLDCFLLVRTSLLVPIVMAQWHRLLWRDKA